MSVIIIRKSALLLGERKRFDCFLIKPFLFDFPLKLIFQLFCKFNYIIFSDIIHMEGTFVRKFLVGIIGCLLFVSVLLTVTPAQAQFSFKDINANHWMPFIVNG